MWIVQNQTEHFHDTAGHFPQTGLTAVKLTLPSTQSAVRPSPLEETGVPPHEPA